MQVPMTEVIAFRRLSWEGEPTREVLVSLGRPAETPGVEDEFYCPIRTTGLGEDEVVTAIFGIDALQALELALRFTLSRLAAINMKNGGRLRWLGEALPKEWAEQENK
jgi:hypothetical protein